MWSPGRGRALSIVGLIVVIHPWPKPQYTSKKDHPTNCNHCLKHDRPRIRNLRVLGSADTAANDNMGMDSFQRVSTAKCIRLAMGRRASISTVAAIGVSAGSFLPPVSQLPARHVAPCAGNVHQPAGFAKRRDRTWQSSRSLDRVYLAFKARKSASASCEERHGPRCRALDTLPLPSRL